VKAGAEYYIALRYLLGRAREGGRYLRGAAAGIALSLIPIIVTLIVSDGMIRGITDRYLELGTGHIQVYYHNPNTDPRNGQAALAGQDFSAFPELQGVWLEQQGLGVVMGNAGKSGASIRAVDPDFLTNEGSARFLRVLAGSAELAAPGEVLLGEELARAVGAEAGKTIYIMSLRVSAAGGSVPRTLPFTVKGIVSSGYQALDALWCIISREGGERILAPELVKTFLTLKVWEPYQDMQRLVSRLRSALGRDYSVSSWMDLQSPLYSSYETTRQLLLFIMALIVLVAAVNVSSAASMLVIDRQRDIAVLKAAGASPGGIGRIFLWASFLTGIAGTALGVLSGLVIGRFITPLVHSLERVLSFCSALFHGGPVKILDPGFYLENIPVIINGKAVALIAVLTILCSVIASWLPARRAGKVRPIELLRKL
jgi:lipoprotein-releasing system permease protein